MEVIIMMKRVMAFIVGMLAALVGGGIACAGSAACGNGLIVIVDDNQISVSLDGITWEDSGTTLNGWPKLHGVTFGDDKFMAVGDTNTIATSKYGQYWKKASSDTWGWDNDFLGVAYGKGLFVAVGGYGSIHTSTNGTDWTLRYGGKISNYNQDLYSVAHGNERYVAVGKKKRIVTSKSGAEWKPLPTANWGWDDGDLFGVTYGNGKFVAVGEKSTILISDDGEDWEQVHDDKISLRGVAYSNSKYVAVGDDKTILTSTDAVRWKAADQVENYPSDLLPLPDVNDFRGVIYVDHLGKFILY
jgi:hypothetical protein